MEQGYQKHENADYDQMRFSNTNPSYALPPTT